MNSTRYLVALSVLSLSIGAHAVGAPALPDRPTSAVTKYKDKWLPVVGADGASPIVVADGNTVTLGPTAGIMVVVGDRFADGLIKVDDLFTRDVPPSNDPNDIASNELKPTEVDVKATLTSTVDIPDAYAVLVTYAPNPDPNAQPTLAAMVRKIGDLAAGKEKSFTARLPKLNPNEAESWSLLVFDSGRQVRSTGMGDILPGYFDRIETAALKKRIAERLSKAADAPVGVFRQMPLGLPDAIKSKYHGTTLKVEIRVGVDGRVLWARPSGISDADLVDALNKGFSTWLFLPPVKDGATVPGSAIIPLKL